MSDQYFANLDGSEIGPELWERVESYFRAMDTSGHLDVINAAFRCYYGQTFNSTGGSSHYISRSGKYGQLRRVRVNHVRNLGLHLLQLSTSQRPAPQPVAINSDAESQEAAVVARGVLDYYSRFKRIERLLRSATERAIVSGEGYVDVSWDGDIGEIIGPAPEGGKPIKEGDLRFHIYSALEVVRAVRPGSDGIGDWVILINPESRWDMIAKHTGVASKDDADALSEAAGTDDTKAEIKKIFDALQAAPKLNDDGAKRNRRPWGAVLSRSIQTSDDCIGIYEFRHAKTPSCPKGRVVRMTEGGQVFFSSDLPYEDLNVRRLSAGELIDTPFSYGPLFDLLAIQEIIDSLYSAVASNQMTFATQLIWALKSADFDYRQLSHGISLLEGNDPSAKPEPLTLTATPPEVFKFIEQLEHSMETLSGVNATVRGNPEYSLKSGSALALIQSQAIQFASTLQQQYAALVEDVYTDMLQLLQMHAQSQRQVIVIGKFNQPYVKSYSGANLSGVKRVVVDSGPAVSQTAAFKAEVARDLLQNGVIKTVDEYLAVVNTGRLEPMIEGDNAELMLIQKENEKLKQGSPVHALPFDKHVLHIQEHRCASSDPDVREDPVRLKALSDHTAEHVQFLSDPALAPILSMLGETPMPMGPPPGKGGPPPGGEPDPSNEPQNEPPNMPTQPKMPKPAKPPTK
jgi:hypothetical protein